MKNYNYTAKDGMGALRKGSLKAVDRSEALNGLKSQGLVPVSVTEGSLPKATLHVDVRFWGVMLASTALALAVGAFFLTQKRKAEPVKRTQDVNITPSVRPVAVPYQAAEKPVGRVSLPARAQQEKPPAAEPVRQSQSAVNQPPAGETQPQQRAEEASLEPTPKMPPPPYSSATERVLNMIVNTRLGYPPPPLPILPLTVNINEILARDIYLYDDDSPETAARKENVANAKLILKDHLAQGGTPEDFLRHYRKQLLDAYDEWREAQQQALSLLKSGDVKTATLYVEQQNKKFSEKGSRTLVLPDLNQ